jgi:hypothetical protein
MFYLGARLGLLRGVGFVWISFTNTISKPSSETFSLGIFPFVGFPRLSTGFVCCSTGYAQKQRILRLTIVR